MKQKILHANVFTFYVCGHSSGNAFFSKNSFSHGKWHSSCVFSRELFYFIVCKDCVCLFFQSYVPKIRDEIYGNTYTTIVHLS